MSSSALTVACVGPSSTLDILSCALVQGVDPHARTLSGLDELTTHRVSEGGQGWLQVNRLGELAPQVVAQACAQARKRGWPVVFLTCGPVPNADEAMFIRDHRPDESLPSQGELQMIRRRARACELQAA